MANVVISVRNLGKRYNIGGPKKPYRTLRESITESLGAGLRIFGPSKRLQASSTTAFWPLKEVSFEVEAGDVIGVIGRNGAGKSTLLKILSRITDPTEGEIDITGRVGSLLEVGTGFHPELTGRENVYLNGAILGMHKSEISEKFDEIVAFAETEKFLDTPVKYYSSGMYTRLAFAVAAHLNPEILIVDEVLAVGDVEFQRKCLGKMKDVSSAGRTVLFVSHNMAAVRSLCTKGLMLTKGRVAMLGPIGDVVDFYMRPPENALDEIAYKSSVPGLAITDVYFESTSSRERSKSLLFGDSYRLCIDVAPSNVSRRAAFVVSVYNLDGTLVTSMNSVEEGVPFFDISSTNGIRYDINSMSLYPSQYRISLTISDLHEVYLLAENAFEFSVESNNVNGAPWAYNKTHGVGRISSSASLV